MKAVEIFNDSPSKGIAFLEQYGKDEPLASIPVTKRVIFLKYAPSLSKKMIGEYLCKSNNKEVLQLFLKDFNFERLRIDVALRIVLQSFRLPGESALIEKIMESFSELYFEAAYKSTTSFNGGCDRSCSSDREGAPTACGPTSSESNQSIFSTQSGSICVATQNGFPFKSSSAAFTLAYSIMMLNTDLHNPNVKERISLEKYLKNIRGINDGEDFTKEFIKEIYDEILKNEIILPSENGGYVGWDFRWKSIMALYRPCPLDQLFLTRKDDEKVNELEGDKKNILQKQTLVSELFEPFKETLSDLFALNLLCLPQTNDTLILSSSQYLVKLLMQQDTFGFEKFMKTLIKSLGLEAYSYTKNNTEESLILSKANGILQYINLKPMLLPALFSAFKVFPDGLLSSSPELFNMLLQLLTTLFVHFGLPLRWLCVSAIRMESILIFSYFGAKLVVARKKETSSPVGVIGKINYLFGGGGGGSSSGGGEEEDSFIHLAVLPDSLIKRLDHLHRSSKLYFQEESLMDEFVNDLRYLSPKSLLSFQSIYRINRDPRHQCWWNDERDGIGLSSETGFLLGIFFGYFARQQGSNFKYWIMAHSTRLYLWNSQKATYQ